MNISDEDVWLNLEFKITNNLLETKRSYLSPCPAGSSGSLCKTGLEQRINSCMKHSYSIWNHSLKIVLCFIHVLFYTQNAPLCMFIVWATYVTDRNLESFWSIFLKDSEETTNPLYASGSLYWQFTKQNLHTVKSVLFLLYFYRYK